MRNLESAQVHVSIEDKFFDNNPEGVFIITNPDPTGGVSHNSPSFVPRAISFNTPVGQTELAAIKGVLVGENNKDTYILRANELHHICFKSIDSDDTTARGIKIFG